MKRRKKAVMFFLLERISIKKDLTALLKSLGSIMTNTEETFVSVLLE